MIMITLFLLFRVINTKTLKDYYVYRNIGYNKNKVSSRCTVFIVDIQGQSVLNPDPQHISLQSLISPV